VATAVVAEGDQKPAAAWENPFVEAAEKASEPDSVAVDEGGRAEE
jgi:hypothetical protein